MSLEHHLPAEGFLDKRMQPIMSHLMPTPFQNAELQKKKQIWAGRVSVEGHALERMIACHVGLCTITSH